MLRECCLCAPLFLLRVKEIVNTQIFARFIKTLLDILFQFGTVTKETAAHTLEFFNHEGSIGDATQSEKIFLPGDAVGKNRTQGAPTPQDQNMEKGFFATQLIQIIRL